MNKVNIYIQDFTDDKYRFGYKLLIESGKDIRTLEILHHLCPAAFGVVYDVEEEITKVINSYEHVTVYCDCFCTSLLNYLKNNCKYTNFEKMVISPISAKN